MAAPAQGPEQAAGLSAACLDALYAALEQGWDADRLHGHPLTPADPDWQPDGPEWVLIGEQGPAVRLAGRFPAAIVESMAQVTL
jgi:hypothetical protein